MFVQEEKIFAGKVLRLHVCTMEGAEWLEEVPEDTTVEKLKERCLKHCVPGSLEDPKTVTHHKLIHATSEKVLTDAKTVLEENIQDRGQNPSGSSITDCAGVCEVLGFKPGRQPGTTQPLAHPPLPRGWRTEVESIVLFLDVLLLIKKRAPPPLPKMADVSAEEKRKQEQKAPDKDAILKATANLPSRNVDRTVAHHNMRDFPFLQFQTELRKILVSLIEVAQKLLALNPDAVELFKKANAMLDEDEEDRVDEIALRQLTEMGFPESRAVKALRLNHMSVTQAMEWLIEHADDPAVDAPLPGQTPSEATAEAGASSTEATAGPSSEAGGEEAKDELTEIFKKIRRKREFRPDPRAVIALMEMGFDEKEVVDALRVNNNQQNAACEWLLGDRKPSPEDLDKAFEDMLENPLNSTQWMNDPETGPVMLQISRIFQTLNRT
ncbi:ubiquitin-associated domain-containing protein 1 isoform X3 [Strix uralensis]|uniref:ubiquitin-associated domain-containing protein 1 isoform X3 n=1 Tax=Strix uralensis TaxID=36305 RepID=UPI003DA7873C